MERRIGLQRHTPLAAHRKSDTAQIKEAIQSELRRINFFQRNGYERNPVAIRNNTVAKLLAATDAKMDTESMLQGAKDLAAAF
jgi:hypothetical protein